MEIVRKFPSVLLYTARVIVLVLFFPIGDRAWPQSNTVEPVSEIQSALQRAQYQVAADLADSAIAHFADLAPAQLAEIHALRALIAFARGEFTAVDAHFQSALQLAPNYQLDPVFFSPAMRSRFEQLRAQLSEAVLPAGIEIRYLVLADPRLNALWKSLLLPGWGQYAKGQRRRAAFFAVASASLAVATLSAHLLRQRAEEDYLAADELTVEARYHAFNRYHQWRNSLGLALGLVWSAAVLDAMIFPARPKAPKMGFGPARDASAPAVLLCLAFRF